jgi:hypothetical protein
MWLGQLGLGLSNIGKPTTHLLNPLDNKGKAQIMAKAPNYGLIPVCLTQFTNFPFDLHVQLAAKVPYIACLATFSNTRR